jgi:hypothetical protein
VILDPKMKGAGVCVCVCVCFSSDKPANFIQMTQVVKGSPKKPLRHRLLHAPKQGGRVWLGWISISALLSPPLTEAQSRCFQYCLTPSTYGKHWLTFLSHPPADPLVGMHNIPLASRLPRDMKQSDLVSPDHIFHCVLGTPVIERLHR